MNDYLKFEYLKGKVLAKVENQNNEKLVFTIIDGEEYSLYHLQDCNETVTIEDICGDLNDLIGEPLLVADEVVNMGRKSLPTEEQVRLQIEEANGEGPFRDGSETWTFYKMGTRKGSVTIRWYGTSNGFYSESVDFCRTA